MFKRVFRNRWTFDQLNRHTHKNGGRQPRKQTNYRLVLQSSMTISGERKPKILIEHDDEYDTKWASDWATVSIGPRVMMISVMSNNVWWCHVYPDKPIEIFASSFSREMSTTHSTTIGNWWLWKTKGARQPGQKGFQKSNQSALKV